MDEMIRKIRASAQLVSLPEIYQQLTQLLEDPGFSMAEVALLVGRDPGLAARFLRIVNSPLNRCLIKIETVCHAVSMLGAKQVHDLVLCASITQTFDGIMTNVMNMRQFWQRSLYCAITAQQLARACQKDEAERLFTIGLLYDIGHLFMYQGVPKKAQQAILQSREKKWPLYLVERELLGFDHAYIAGMLMKEWSLPKSLRIPVTCHLEPETAHQYVQETALLHLAALLVESDLEEESFGTGPFAVSQATWELTGLTDELCLEVRQTAVEDCKKVVKAFFP